VVDQAPVVLLIDDDVAFSTEVAEALDGYDLATEVAHDWDAAVASLARHQPAIIILDQRLGRVDALSRLAQLRTMTAAPILLLTGNTSEADRIIGLEIGADDFLQKPISTRELLARIRAHMRRGPLPDRSEGRWRIAGTERRVYTPAGAVVPLTTTEFELFRVLSQRVGEPVARDALSELVLRRPYRAEDRAIDNLVYQLRLKLRDAGAGDTILSARGRGYYFVGFPDAG